MKLHHLEKEVTYYMTVDLEDGNKKTYVRTAFSEWCIEVQYGTLTSLERVTGIIAKELEAIFEAHPYH